MKRYITISAIFLTLAYTTFAQGSMDAMLFSRYYTGGTARYTAMSGAFGALGGDFSTLSTNPAGIGVYRSSEFVFTTGVSFNNVESKTLNIASQDNQVSMNIGNIGYIGTINTTKTEGLVSLNWGIGMNRLHDFNRNSYYRTRGNTSSLTDVMAAEMVDDGITLNDVPVDNYNWSKSSKWRNLLGWNNFLIDYNGSDDTYYSALLKETTTNQDKFINERGSINEWDFSFGGNISHKFYFGATLGVQSIDYTREITFSETFVSNWADGSTYKQYDYQLDKEVGYTGGSFTHTDYLRTKGTGVNLKAGAIYRPIDALRLGFAIHTPTFYGLNDQYSQNINSDIFYPDGVNGNGLEIDQQTEPFETPDGNFDYRLQTPMKIMASAAYVFGKIGLLSAEYEMTDYSGMRLRGKSGSSIDFMDANTMTRSIYGISHAIRGGAEVQLNNYFKLRGGVAYYSNPNTNEAENYSIEQYGDMMSFSGGIGFRNKGFFLDMAYMHRKQNAQQYLYHYNGPNTNITDIMSQNTLNDNLINLTLGFKF